jgi:hypothetical protein
MELKTKGFNIIKDRDRYNGMDEYDLIKNSR